MTICIRPAQPNDAKTLHQNCYPEHRAEDVHDYLSWCLRQASKGWILRLVAEVNGHIVGNAQLTIWGQTGEIGSLVVAKPFRNQGIARQLLTDLIAEAKNHPLTTLEIAVQAHQPGIVAFYKSLGFQPWKANNKGLSPPAFCESNITLRMAL